MDPKVKKTLEQMKGLLKVWRKLPPLIAIPTTPISIPTITPIKKLKTSMLISIIPFSLFHQITFSAFL